MARVVLRAVRDLRACPENRRLGRSLLPPPTSTNRLGIRRVPPHGVFSKLARGDQFGTTRVMGEWDTLICRVPVSARPIMTRALANIQIVINRLLRSLCITKGPPLVERRAPPTKAESTRSPGWAQASRQEAQLRCPRSDRIVVELRALKSKVSGSTIVLAARSWDFLS